MLPVRLKQRAQPLTDQWQRVPIEAALGTLVGLSFRPRQVEAFGLDARTTLATLLRYPLQLIRLGAYWNRIESRPGQFDTSELDWQMEAVERAGIPILLCIGPLKSFGYPEFYPPAHHLAHPFPEHTRIVPSAYPELLEASSSFINRLVERYRRRTSIIGWQLEHEAVDPLGVEHSWRLDADFVAAEARALRAADPGRPLMMNGYLPASVPVGLPQWWRTRDQGDSLAVAQRLADIVGIDYYPRNALVGLGSRALYVDGSRSPYLERRLEELFRWAQTPGHRLMVSEGQAEPWETSVRPPSPGRQTGAFSCLPEDVIHNYNRCLRWSRPDTRLYAYLFWGAEYWVLRQERYQDPRYLQAFARILGYTAGE
jgi:hypothetical protein